MHPLSAVIGGFMLTGLIALSVTSFIIYFDEYWNNEKYKLYDGTRISQEEYIKCIKFMKSD